MKRLLLIIFMCLMWPGFLSANAAGARLVIVTSAQSPIHQMTPDEARKLYLGMPMVVDGKLIHPLRNNSDATMQEMFMQKVMFMSTQAYERQILSRVFRTGGNRPPVYTEMPELLKALESDHNAVTYLPRDTAISTVGVRIILEP
ncbi:MAG: hypothetical protein ABFE02_12525 [Sulfuricella sp.]